MKKQIQQVLKDPEELDRIERSQTQSLEMLRELCTMKLKDLNEGNSPYN